MGEGTSAGAGDGARPSDGPAGSGTASASASAAEERRADSDSDRLARIDAYVRDQQKSGSDWVGKVSTYVGLAAFFFGIGTFADLQHRFSASDRAAAAATAGAVDSLQSVCAKDRSGAVPPKSADYGALAAYDRSVLVERDARNYIWEGLNTSDLPDEDVELFTAMKHSYFAASDFLAAALSAAEARDARGYATAVGQYNDADSLFLEESAAFGLAQGACSWAVPDAPDVTSVGRAAQS
ncbi:hypothetical protein [Streptomyces sp. NPDC020983]|uniref:hypothetical protein n=1 Tax=Streptomyces sp. NPDC020983 TaxID=3365106 RepID=UPI0037B514B3